MPFTDQLLAGVAQLLADAGAGTWRPSGSYLPGDQTPITVGTVPAAPDRVLTLTAYAVNDDYSLSDSTVGVQVRTRGDRDPRTVDALDDAAFDALHGLGPTTLAGGVRVVAGWRQSGSPLGPDDSGRHQRSANFYLTVHRPSAHRT